MRVGRLSCGSLVIAAAVAALVPAGAGAVAADVWQVQLTPAGQAAARATVLKRGDLGGAGWTGGSKKADTSDASPCPSFKPKQSDLVLIGAADAEWKQAGISVESQVNVLQNAKMVKLDWQRTVLPPQVLSCLRSGLSKAVAPGTLVSFKRMTFPSLGSYSRAYRGVIALKSAAGTTRVLVDTIAFGRGRSEVTLLLAAPAAAAAALRPLELRLSRLLAARAR